MSGIDEAAPSHQLIVVARLAEFCSWQGGHKALDRDPWRYMLDKLLQIEEPLTALKETLYRKTTARLLEELAAGPLDDERYADYRLLYEKLLSRGDFADLAFHLCAKPPPDPAALKALAAKLKPQSLYVEERKPASERSPSWEKLVGELHGRLGIDTLTKVLSRRKPRPANYRAYVLRRLRRVVKEYCAVVHVPLTAADTFTPFMLPRLEAIVAANLRFLNQFR
jgi:hypothetical protein